MQGHRNFRWESVLVFALVLSLSGCGDTDQLEVHPVKIRVLYDGKPAVKAQVTLHPQSKELRDKRIYPGGYVDENGSVVLTTYEPGDGAPEGKYAVTIVWTVVNPKAADPEAAEGGSDRLNGAYANPATTKFKVAVKQDTASTFELKIP